MELKQSNAEIFRIAKDWEELYAPQNLIRDARTASLLVEWVIANEGIASFTGFNHAVEALGPQVLYPEAPLPKVKTQDEIAKEFQAKEFARIQRETLENSVPFSERFTAAEKVQRAAKQATKAQADAEGTLKVLIASYQCYGLGHVDFLVTEQVQKELKTIVVRDAAGKRDAVRTLAAVRTVINALPDHPVSGDVYKVVQSMKS